MRSEMNLRRQITVVNSGLHLPAEEDESFAERKQWRTELITTLPEK